MTCSPQRRFPGTARITPSFPRSPPTAGAAALPAAAAAARAAAKPLAHPGAAPHCLVDDPFGAQLDLDDDCLRLLLGEDADESGPCASAAGSGKGPAAGSGMSQRSSATGGGAAAGAAPGDAEAASLPARAQAAVKEEDDDIAMLFGELRWASRPGGAHPGLHTF